MTAKPLPTATKLYISQSHRIFHCNCKIKIPYGCDEELLDQAFEILREVDQKYNSYQPDSYFSRINQNAGNWVETDETTAKMIEVLKLVSEVTNGAFDISSMPLMRLWGFYDNIKTEIPADKEIFEVLQHVDFKQIETNGINVKIAKGMELITGSFIKAFAVDQVTEFLIQNQINDAIINAGGSTIKAINPENNPHWSVNIPDPFQTEQFLQTIQISNECFSLSGKLNNHLVINHRKYSHILNAKTGFPSHAAQVGVLSKDAFTGDILSTALSSLPFEEVEKVAEQLQNHFAFSYYRIEDSGEKTESTCR